MQEAELRDTVTTLLGAHTVMSLATLHAGRAHAANLMFAPDGFRLYWFSAANSRHSQALGDDPRVTATVAAQYADYSEIHGLQLIGTARALSDHAERDRGLTCLTGRFPFLAQFRGGAGVLAQRLQLAAVYCLEPEQITLIDNRRGFGFKRTLEL
jgi:uncharacterized protein YhbP (UPF0306 family)